MTPETRQKISRTLRSNYASPSYKEMVAAAQRPCSGENHWNWKGGITPVNQQERNTEEVLQWRKKVYQRDMYHCRLCKTNSDKLHAHHILPWSSFPEKRTEVSNGITLCETCHSTIHTYLKEISHQTEQR
jgi:predicted HNH restriction endonuclease